MNGTGPICTVSGTPSGNISDVSSMCPSVSCICVFEHSIAQHNLLRPY